MERFRNPFLVIADGEYLCRRAADLPDLEGIQNCLRQIGEFQPPCNMGSLAAEIIPVRFWAGPTGEDRMKSNPVISTGPKARWAKPDRRSPGTLSWIGKEAGRVKFASRGIRHQEKGKFLGRRVFGDKRRTGAQAGNACAVH